ncbi:DEAD/DEAH box helicase family protein [Thioalkalivibrio sp. ALE23]|uniref:DEAD/DEAH box helicase family protein n=1 Tax=Thioalkalivibrio sp. ALE23 TaxID=1265495 RepID=UPI00036EF746|nr:DEAD/DEAH box helicase family protein [Thioalkalivibrio sp. ALE23]
MSIQANLTALRLLADLDANPRDLSDAERADLLAYRGWGAHAAVFDPAKDEHEGVRRELRQLVSPDEYDAMRASVLDAYFTPPELIRAMYDGVRRLGFEGGKVLEPTVGAGAFIEHAPDDLAASMSFTGIELDPVSARIAGYLYPDHHVLNRSFESTPLQADSYDMAIGNPPYDRHTVDDLSGKTPSGPIHTFTIAKAMSRVRPGGLGAFVVSRYTLDGENAALDWLRARTRLIAAYRLPTNVFRSAGAEVVTDVVFLQRVDPDNGVEHNADEWSEKDGCVIHGQDGTDTICGYFDFRPGHLIGTPEVKTNQYMRPAFTLEDAAPGWLDGLTHRIEQDLEPVMTGEGVEDEADPSIVPDAPAAVFGFAQDRETGDVVQRLPDHADQARWCRVPGIKGARLKRMNAMRDLRDRLRDLLDAESSDAPESRIESMRDELRENYRAFVKRFGAIHARANASVYREDPDYALIQGLELDYDPGLTAAQAAKEDDEPRDPSWRESDILHRRTIHPSRDHQRPQTPEAALLDSLTYKGGVDFPYMEQRSRIDSATLMEALKGQVFPADAYFTRWETRNRYLSGNVREKLEKAKSLAETQPIFEANVEALESVLPEWIPASDITVPVGAAWLPPDVMTDFMRHMVDAEPPNDPRYVAGQWHFPKVTRLNHAKNQSVWGGPEDWPFCRIFEALSNHHRLAVFERDREGKRVQNMDLTRQLENRAREIREAWDEWIMDDADRRERLESIYNENYNCFVEPQYDGTFLLDDDGTLPGSSRAFVYDRHQINAAWRVAQDGTALIDHVVGAGKTLTAITGAFLAKRMGRVNKPCFVVPGHLVGQWADEYRKAFPDARVLAASEDEFAGNKRSRLFSRIALNDWDAIIIPHSSFQFIEMPAHEKTRHLDEMRESLEAAIREAQQMDDSRDTLRSMERAKKRINNRIESLIEKAPKDRTVTVDAMGIDSIVVDEYHKSYKNLFYFTGHQDVGGLGKPDGSMASLDLLLKGRWVQETEGQGGLVLLSGTPISNSVSEMYTVLRFLAMDELKAMGIDQFDAWASLFATPTSAYELSSSGKYKLKTRFREFNNLPELMRLYRRYADVIHTPDLKAIYAEKGKEWPTPEIRTGEPIMVQAERSATQSRMMDDIVKRADNPPSDPKQDNALKIFSDAGKIALDPRMIEPSAPDYAFSKINECCRNVCHEYLNWNHVRGTQLIFLDSGTPKAEADENMDLYSDIREKLVALGIPRREIAFIHEAPTPKKKKDLFRRMRCGDLRVLIGTTAKMGEGMNVQERLVAKHDLDAPFRPSDVEQRDGRIIRRGNALRESEPDFAVALYRYGTMKTLDAMRWAILETKAHFIGQVRKGSVNDRTVSDAETEAAESGFAAMKAELSGNPLILEHFEKHEEYKNLKSVERGEKRARHKAESTLSEEAKRRASLERMEYLMRQDLDTLNTHGDDLVLASPHGGSVSHQGDRKAFVAHLEKAVSEGLSQSKKVLRSRGFLLGQLNGLNLELYLSPGDQPEFWLRGQGASDVTGYKKGERISPTGLVRRLSNIVHDLRSNIEPRIERKWQAFHDEMAGARDVLNREPKVTREDLDRVAHRIQEIEAELSEQSASRAENADAVEAEPEMTFSEWLAENGPIVTPEALAPTAEPAVIDADDEPLPETETVEDDAAALALETEDAEAFDAGSVDPIIGTRPPKQGETLDLFADAAAA